MLRRVGAFVALCLVMCAAAAQYPCVKGRPWKCFSSIELTLAGDGGTGEMGMRIFGGQDIMLEYRDKLSAARKALALGPPPMQMLYLGVPDKEIQEGHPFIFFDYGFAAPMQALESAYPEGPLSVPEKETESRVRLDGEIDATLFATRLSGERVRFRITMPKIALVQEGVVDFARTLALPDTFQLDGWKDRGLRSYRTVGEARAAKAP